MKFAAALFVLVCLSPAAAFAQGREGQTPPVLRTDMVTPNIPGVVAAGTKIEIVASGLRGSDAGVGLPDGSVLITTGGSLAKVDADGKVTTLVQDSGNAAGLTVDSKGRVIAAQYSKKVSVLYPQGSEKVLADKYEGKPFIRPNDLIVDKKGGVYFTDCYQIGAKRSADDLPQAVYYISPAGALIRVADDIARPNGITLSPDEKTLYINDWAGGYLLAYDVQGDGRLANRRNFGKYDLEQKTDTGLVSGADGLCIDSKRNTFATTPAGVQVFNAKGEHLGNLPAPYDEPPQNCGFGGPNKQYLYVLGRGVVYRIRTIAPGSNHGK